MRRIATINGYIAAAPREARDQLRALRKAIQEAAPEAEEGLDLDLPSFFWEGTLCWFGVATKWVSFFPTAEAVKHFKRELEGFNYKNGTIRFKFGEKIPVALVKKMVKWRLVKVLEEGIDPP
jgi:uncharacterized protein YdhG (YjbR/CyaY superfamily)